MQNSLIVFVLFILVISVVMLLRKLLFRTPDAVVRARHIVLSRKLFFRNPPTGGHDLSAKVQRKCETLVASTPHFSAIPNEYLEGIDRLTGTTGTPREASFPTLQGWTFSQYSDEQVAFTSLGLHHTADKKRQYLTSPSPFPGHQ